MEYYLIQPDKRYTDAPRFADLQTKLDTAMFLHNKPHMLPQRSVVNTHPNANVDFVDFLHQSVPLFSTKAMNVLKNFDKDFLSKQVIAFEPGVGQDESYQLLFLPRFETSKPLELLQSTDELFPSELAVTYPFFYVFSNMNCHLAIRLDVVEGLIRNGRRGFVVQRIFTGGKE